MKNNILFISLVACLSFSAYCHADDESAISKIYLDGNCKDIEKPGEARGAESFSVIGAAIATAVVKEGVSYVAQWFKDFKDTYKGSNTVTNVDMFYCARDNSEKYIGIKENLVYKRFGADTGDIHIQLTSGITMLGGTSSTPGFFVITPKSLTYNKPIAKRGKVKDITVVYIFTFFEKDGSEKTFTSEPILFNSIKTGSNNQNLAEKYGAKIIFPLPEILSVNTADAIAKDNPETPFKVTIQVSEVSPGKGEELAGNITKAIGETIEKDSDAITKMILKKLLKDATDDSAPPAADGPPRS